MGYSWNEITPGDQYKICSARLISPVELTYVTHLYQPLIGSFAASLFITLYHELPMDTARPQTDTHRSLMSLLSAPLHNIVKAREILEAVGLVRTTKWTRDDQSHFFEYILQPPMSPDQFFGDDLMSIILFNRVGKQKFRKLRARFIGPAQEEFQGTKTEVTKGFDEVFQSISPSELMIAAGSETEQFFSEMNEMYPNPRSLSQTGEPTAPVQFVKETLDFAFLEAALPKTMMKERILSAEIRRVIEELSFLYHLDVMQISYFLQDHFVYTDRGEISPQLLRSAVKEWYSRQNNTAKPPEITYKDQGQKKPKEKPVVPDSSKEVEHKLALAKVSPIVLLEQYQGGSKVSQADLKIVEELTSSYQLAPGVVNVLLEYVMITNNKQLPKSLILKIASHWKRLNIQTIEEALEQAKSLYQGTKSKEKLIMNDKPRQTGGKAPFTKKQTTTKTDLPEWVVNQTEASVAPSNKELNEEQKRQAQELLKALGEIK
jgi:replication initiation and membrane attachment protein